MDSEFLELLEPLVASVFDRARAGSIAPKLVHGQTLRAPQFLAYMKEYVRIFDESETFPTVETYLKATARGQIRCVL